MNRKAQMASPGKADQPDLPKPRSQADLPKHSPAAAPAKRYSVSARTLVVVCDLRGSQAARFSDSALSTRPASVADVLIPTRVRSLRE